MNSSLLRAKSAIIEPSLNEQYDEDYYERGVVVGKSGYLNYRWMPELTIPMAHYMIINLGISEGRRVLDYGCAKGFLVKALRLLGAEAEGVDVSRYAIENIDAEVRTYCRLIDGIDDPNNFVGHYDFMIAKDVFEHISKADLRIILVRTRRHCDRLFVAVPLADNDFSNVFIIPEYNKDITHITAKTASWWANLFIEQGWRVHKFSYKFAGMKENWTNAWPKGNAFFVLSSA
jgi:SAM-dependent methyltransferase